MLMRCKRFYNIYWRAYYNIGVRQNSSSSENAENKNLSDKLKNRTKVPLKPVSTKFPEILQTIEIDSKSIQLLERLSLVDIDNKEALKTLEASIQFADRITNIETIGIEPLYTVLENCPLALRDDNVADGNIKDDILKNATVVEEDYFVAPPGNIPLEQEDKKFD